MWSWITNPNPDPPKGTHPKIRPLVCNEYNWVINANITRGRAHFWLFCQCKVQLLNSSVCCVDAWSSNSSPSTTSSNYICYLIKLRMDQELRASVYSSVLLMKKLPHITLSKVFWKVILPAVSLLQRYNNTVILQTSRKSLSKMVSQ